MLWRIRPRNSSLFW